MRSIGFIVAIITGILASILHFNALSAAKKAVKVKSTGFAAVKHDYAVGDVLGEPGGDKGLKDPELFYQIMVPDKAKVPGVQISKLATAIRQIVTRPLKKGDMLFLQDLAPPQAQLKIGEKFQRGLFVSLSGVTFEPSLVRVGSRIGFIVEDTESSDLDSENEFDAGGTRREIGPFLVLSIGDQLAYEATGKSPIIAVIAEVDDEQRLDEMSDALLAAEGDRRLKALTLLPTDNHEQE